MHITRVSRAACAPFILGIHYARRWPSISPAFGLFDGAELVGVVTYGTPPSAPLRTGIAGPDLAPHVLELNRLCLRHNRHNEASRLVGGSLKLLPPSIVVSFADTSQGHVGTVYQACNFGYFGLSAKRTDWKIQGEEHLHGQTIADRYRGVENRAAAIRADYGDRFSLAPRPRKHRYITITGDRRWRRMVEPQIRYKREPYPKKGADVDTDRCGVASYPRRHSLPPPVVPIARTVRACGRLCFRAREITDLA